MSRARANSAAMPEGTGWGLRWLWLSAVVVALDQLSKWLATRLLDPHQPVTLTAWFDLTLMYNRGAAFSFLSGAGGWQRWLFVALALVIGAVLVAWLRHCRPGERWVPAALALVLGGAAGNLIDRLLHGKVVDFIVWHYRDWYWPAFNLADSAISAGAVMLILDGLLLQRRRPPDR
ncbi:MAG: lipoprotein signal peptidase [Gammaproteobacteria bacterium]|nr:MAG: lipoprotein signal peptidase [Gammaproteobacteria bacterium]